MTDEVLSLWFHFSEGQPFAFIWGKNRVIAETAAATGA